jgi:hypothetical protein
MPTLTSRQKEVQALIKQGRTPREVADALGITENGVYQHMRRIKAAGGKKAAGAKPAAKRTATKAAKPSAAKPTRKRSGTRSRTTTRSQAQSTLAAASAPVKAPTPLDAIRAQRGELTARLDVTKGALEAAQAALKAADEAHAKALKELGPELQRLDTAEGVLTGKIRRVNAAPAPAKQRTTNGSAPAANAETPVAPQAPAEEQQAAPAPAPEEAPAEAPAPAPVQESEPLIGAGEFAQVGGDGFE